MTETQYYFSCPECDFEKSREGYVREEPTCPKCEFREDKIVELERVYPSGIEQESDGGPGA